MTAQEMFEELGFEYKEYIDMYGSIVEVSCVSNKLDICFYGIDESVDIDSHDGSYIEIDIKLLKAINQQCKELRWIE